MLTVSRFVLRHRLAVAAFWIAALAAGAVASAHLGARLPGRFALPGPRQGFGVLAVALNLASAGGTYGVLALVWQHGANTTPSPAGTGSHR